MPSPLVSICCITFNHKDYITQCLDGFVSQQCDFSFEILIHDDASNDGTSDIIREYQLKYPDIVKPVIQVENQWSKGVRGMNAKFNIPRAAGKYIAKCEGDDYWIDPLKLQKQVDFLEANPEYSLVCGGFKSVNTKTGEESVILKNVEESSDNTDVGFDITLDRFFSQWLTKTLTLIYRKDFHKEDDLIGYKYAKDVHFNYHLLKRGKGYYMKEVFGVYHIHEGGTFSNNSRNEINIDNYFVLKDLYLRDKNNPLLRNKFRKTIAKIINHKLYENKKVNKKVLLLELFKLIENKKDVVDFLKSFYRIIKNKHKLIN